VNYRQARRLCESGNQVLVDPHKRTEWSRYDGAHCVKGSHLFFAEDYGQSACSPIRIITHAEQGSQLWRTGHASPVWIPAISTRVADTTGAGDCYLAALACCTAAGVPTFEACQFASVVASMSVERIGTEPIYPHEIRDWASTVACS
jgi:bifunctional ADP-heptose synthase (sugar kinase/adenylyltransferase)